MLDRYTSPELLAIRRPPPDGSARAGEGTTADTFALGLVLFECLVQPLHAEEQLPLPLHYGHVDHVAWIHRLLERVDSARAAKQLFPTEVSLLKRLLNPDPTKRVGDVDSILEEVRTVAGSAPDVKLRTVLGQFLFRNDDVFKPVKVLSGGERSRVALAKFLIQPTNVLLLDEPTNHLDKTTRRKLLEALQGYEGTIVCASHDPGIVEGVATHVFEVKDGSVRELLHMRKD